VKFLFSLYIWAYKNVIFFIALDRWNIISRNNRRSLGAGRTDWILETESNWRAPEEATRRTDDESLPSRIGLVGRHLQPTKQRELICPLILNITVLLIFKKYYNFTLIRLLPHHLVIG